MYIHIYTYTYIHIYIYNKSSSQATRRTSVLLEGLGFANGVALSKDEKWLLVAETKYARVLRYWCETMNRIYINT